MKYCSKCGKHNELCSWIVTLDVLKWRRIPFYDSLDLLNSNIRCIEMGNNDAAILASRGWIVTLDVLKYNKSCRPLQFLVGWIVTLDVLKSLMELLLLYRIGSWIVTLDVLKLYAEENTKSDYCRWIVTLDVLKSA